MKNSKLSPGLNFREPRKSHAKYIPTDPKLAAIRKNMKWATTPNPLKKKI